MKKFNDYWVDENNNTWGVRKTTEEQAVSYSNNLINCKNCNNCIDCIGCNNCSGCRSCRICVGCYACKRCYSCDDCSNCISCYNCRSCGNCRNCHSCINCRDCIVCKDCRHCKDFESSPQIYRTRKIGSRKDITLFYYTKEKGCYVACGGPCFWDTLDNFEMRVKEVHGDNEYAKEYLKEIEKVKMLFDLKK